jgi:hypothetical protein
LRLNFSGTVFDVSTGRDYYGKGGTYNVFAGKDASRALVCGCMNKEVQIYDYRGLKESQLNRIEYWQKFYWGHASYFYVGKVPFTR